MGTQAASLQMNRILQSGQVNQCGINVNEFHQSVAERTGPLVSRNRKHQNRPGVKFIIRMLTPGSVLTEFVFAYPGMGRLVVQAIYQRDFAVVQAFVLVVAVIIVSINLFVDIMYAYLDPRIVYR